jgi:predicted DNA-binding transcriptional regulator YafY
MRCVAVIRQWNVLQAIAASRHGQTIDQLAELAEVSTRTIRRDLEALSVAGFPLYDEVVGGERRWKLAGHPFAAMVEKGFTLQEVCAVYFSRSLLETLAGMPFQAHLATAFAKIERALSPAMRAFLDRLPEHIAAKRAPGSAREAKDQGEIVSKLMEAVLFRRQADITYWSISSRRQKQYRIHPYRITYGLGALYLSAYVEEYGEVRTFALSRVRRVSLREEHFAKEEGFDGEAFGHSLGIHVGPPVHVEIEFTREVAPYIKEREWHPSQRVTEHADGGVTIALEVCDDWALRSWILGFGPRARVVAPATLAEAIRTDLEEGAARYGSAAFAARDLERWQRRLPFWTERAAS